MRPRISNPDAPATAANPMGKAGRCLSNIVGSTGPDPPRLRFLPPLPLPLRDVPGARRRCSTARATAEIRGEPAGERADGHAGHAHRREPGETNGSRVRRRTHRRLLLRGNTAKRCNVVGVDVVKVVLRLAPPTRVHRHASIGGRRRTRSTRRLERRLVVRVSRLPWFGGRRSARCAVILRPRPSWTRIRDSRGNDVRVRSGLTRGEGAPPADVHSHSLRGEARCRTRCSRGPSRRRPSPPRRRSPWIRALRAREADARAPPSRTSGPRSSTR